ncbi:MAG: glycyl-radical enzyme activating protein [Ruminococcaceae bacterium]|nr:glycyl-radical enzyme activating protein [Oscillospiraceae bacterium]
MENEKCTGIITQIQRCSVHDGPGIRSTVFLKGCNLRCIWCHNPETYSGKIELQHFAAKCTLCGRCVDACPEHAREIDGGGIIYKNELCSHCFTCERNCLNSALQVCGKEYTVDELCGILVRDKKYYDKSGGGVTFSGGEPLLQHEYVFECARRLQEEGVSSAVETASNVPESVIRESVKHFSHFMCDIKAIDPTLHKSLTGVTNERILDNIRLLASLGTNILVRIPVAMGLNGTDENIAATARFMKENGLEQIELLKLHDLSEHKYNSLGLPITHPSGTEPTDSDIERFYTIIKDILGERMTRGFKK